MIELAIIVLMFPLWLLGAIDVFYFFKAPLPPFDTSNRINNIRLWWLTKKISEVNRARLVSVWPWLTKDEGDILDEANKKH